MRKALYLLSDTGQGQQNCLEMFMREAVTLVPTTPATLNRVSALMKN